MNTLLIINHLTKLIQIIKKILIEIYNKISKIEKKMKRNVIIKLKIIRRIIIL